MPHHAPRQTRITLFIVSGLCCLLLVAGLASKSAAEFRVRPSIAISEEYSDNINQEQDKRSEFTTRVRPALSMDYEAKYWDAALNYGFEYLYYAQGNKKKSRDSFARDDTRHTVNARVLARLVPNLLFLEVQNDYRRVDLNLIRAGQTPAGIEYAPDQPVAPGPDADERDVDDVDAAERDAADRGPGFIETTARERESSDRNVFSFSPYVLFQPTVQSILRTGYRYANTWYREENIRTSDLHEAFLDAGYDLTAKFGLDAGYRGAWERERERDAGPALETVFEPGQGAGSGREDRHTLYVGARYAYGRGSLVFARFGHTWRRSPDRPSTDDPYWNAGITHAFASMTLAASTLVSYSTDPLRDRTRRTIINAASLTRPYARGRVVLSGGYALYDEPRGRRTSAGLSLDHDLTRRLTGTARLDFSRRQEDREVVVETGEQWSRDRVNEWRARLGLSRVLGRDFTAGLNYQYTDSSANDPLSDDNFQENRVTLELRKTF